MGVCLCVWAYSDEHAMKHPNTSEYLNSQLPTQMILNYPVSYECLIWLPDPGCPDLTVMLLLVLNWQFLYAPGYILLAVLASNESILNLSFISAITVYIMLTM